MMKANKKYKQNLTGQHRMQPISKGCAIPYCTKCGIIALRNKETAKVINKPCKDQDRDED